MTKEERKLNKMSKSIERENKRVLTFQDWLDDEVIFKGNFKNIQAIQKQLSRKKVFIIKAMRRKRNIERNMFFMN